MSTSLAEGTTVDNALLSPEVKVEKPSSLQLSFHLKALRHSFVYP